MAEPKSSASEGGNQKYDPNKEFQDKWDQEKARLQKNNEKNREKYDKWLRK